MYRTRHTTLFTLMGLALALALVAGCFPPPITGTGSDQPGTVAPVDPTVAPEPTGVPSRPAALPPLAWQLETIKGEAAPEGSTAYIKFGPANKVSGSTGCNNIGGTYTVDSPRLTFSSIASTKMYCEGRMDLEQAFLEALAATAAYASTPARFTLLDAAGAQLATFTPRTESGLGNTGWIATGINNGQGGVVSVTGEVTAIFGTNGRVSGKAGCNSYNADYTVDGERLTIGQPVSTLMACAEAGVMEQEAAFLKALPQTATFAIDGDVLELRDASGAMVATFRKAKG